MFLVSRWQDVIENLTDSKGTKLVSEDELLASMTSSSKFELLLQSEKWTTIYDSHLFAASKVVEQEELAYVPLFLRRYGKMTRYHLSRWQKEDITIHKLHNNVEAYLQLQTSRKASEEFARLADQSSSLEQERKLYARQWLNLYRELTFERGIWTPDNVDSVESEHGTKWKLDRVENLLRMRKRLTQNHDFDDHKDASARRDKTSVAGGASIAQGSPRVERALMSHAAAAALATAAFNRKKAQIEKLKTHFESGASVEAIREISSSAAVASVNSGEDVDDEEWQQVSEDNIVLPTNGTDEERAIYSADCEMILLMTAVKGRLEITNYQMTFYPDLRGTAATLNEADQKTLGLLAESELLLRERKWPLATLMEVYPRRYLLRKSAIEFFFLDRTNYMFNFNHVKDRGNIFSKIMQVKPPNLIYADMRNPVEVLRKSGLTEKWRRHEISNFEYLMHLNTISGWSKAEFLLPS
jgi:hypothetical protein